MVLRLALRGALMLGLVLPQACASGGDTAASEPDSGPGGSGGKGGSSQAGSSQAGSSQAGSAQAGSSQAGSSGSGTTFPAGGSGGAGISGSSGQGGAAGGQGGSGGAAPGAGGSAGQAGAAQAGAGQAGAAGAGAGGAGAGGGAGSGGSAQAGSAQAGAGGCGQGLPAGWPSAWETSPANPVLVASSDAALQGQDNVYAPEILRQGDLLLMWYGAQGGDGHDRIYFAWSRDGYTWQKYPSGADPQPALDHGSSNHVNDPSAVRGDDGMYRVYYTDAGEAEIDRIWLAQGSSPAHLSKVGEVIGVGPAGAWDSEKVGRPAVIRENGVYRMWYDGTHAGQRHVGYAESADGVSWTKHPGNPLFLNAGAVDVKRVGDTLVMLREGGDGTYWATSVDGLCWVDRGKLFGLSGKPYDAFGQVTPFLLVDPGPRAVYFGGAKVVSWNQNRIALARPAGQPDGPGGCAGCLAPGRTCAEACRAAGVSNDGTCGNPGSTDPGACCACKPDGCEACSGGQTCQAACVAAGKDMGFCGNPGSADPSACCGCQ